jgi:hypothetical protein
VSHTFNLLSFIAIRTSAITFLLIVQARNIFMAHFVINYTGLEQIKSTSK